MHWAKQLLELFGENGEHWTQNSYAKTYDGHICSYDSPEAVCWCLLGAMNKLFPIDSGYDDILLNRILKRNYGGIVGFNDNSTFTEVKEVLTELAAE